MISALWFVVFALCALLPLNTALALDQVQTGKEMLVGRSVLLEQLVLNGPKYKAKPINSDTPVVVKINAVYPHGNLFRYDIDVYGLDPGEYELVDFLEPEDAGAEVGDPPSFKLTVKSTLGEGQVKPNELTLGRSPWLGGYRLALWLAGIAWVAGLLALIFVGRKRKSDEQLAQAAPLTTADRLRPLVRDAVDGKLGKEQRSLLERLLLTHWRERLNLTDDDPVEGLAALREHPEAGKLLRSLEDWLHRPDSDRNMDIESLLSPYLDGPVDGSAEAATQEAVS